MIARPVALAALLLAACALLLTACAPEPVEGPERVLWCDPIGSDYCDPSAAACCDLLSCWLQTDSERWGCGWRGSSCDAAVDDFLNDACNPTEEP